MLFDPYESGGKRIRMQRGWRVLSCGAGVSPAFLRFVNAAKIAGETPAPRKSAYSVTSPFFQQIRIVVRKRC
jgi:hypothetical protein